MRRRYPLPVYSLFFLAFPLLFVACKKGETLPGGGTPPSQENYCCMREDDVKKDEGVKFICVDRDPSTPMDPDYADREYFLVRERAVMEHTRDPRGEPGYDDRMEELECNMSGYGQWEDAWRTYCYHCCRPDQEDTEECEIPAPPGDPWGCGAQGKGLYTGCLDRRFLFLRPDKKADGSANPKPEPGRDIQNVEFTIVTRKDLIQSGQKAGGLVPWCMDCENCGGTWRRVCSQGSLPPECQVATTSRDGEVTAQACDPGSSPVCQGADRDITWGSPPEDYTYLFHADAFMKSLDPGSSRRDLGTYTMDDGTEFYVYKNIIQRRENDDILTFIKQAVPANPGGDAYAYIDYTKVFDVAPGVEGPTLQLEPYYPPEPEPEEGWWNSYIPECKPLIYLYPEEETTLTVVPKPKGYVTVSEPSMNPYHGWERVVAQPDGTLEYKGEEYSSLYYESLVTELFVPKEGFVVKREELEEFFDEYLPKKGLNEEESIEFKNYWLGRLSSSEYYFVRFLTMEEIEKIEPMDINVTPDTFIRVRAYFKPLDYKIDVDTQKLSEPPMRTGFTLVEWGGLFEGEERPFFDRIFEIVKAFLRQAKFKITS